ERLRLRVAGTHREVADLAVPHHAGGQPDRDAARLELRMRLIVEDRVEPRRVGARRRIRRRVRREAPAVEDAQHHRPVGRGHAPNARMIVANSSDFSDAAPTSAPSMPSARANRATVHTATLPPYSTRMSSAGTPRS